MPKVSKPNWLVQQILAAKKEAEAWSEWKRNAYLTALLVEMNTHTHTEKAHLWRAVNE